jgi:hypothetical protein
MRKAALFGAAFHFWSALTCQRFFSFNVNKITLLELATTDKKR